MRVLVACEFSGIVRDAFIEAGHDAVSCDLLPSERPGPHIQGDALQAIRDVEPDLLIAHPPCTYLSRAGARWWRDPERQAKADEAAAFVFALRDAPVDRIAIENPIGQLNQRWRYPDQTVHPWQFGHPYTKATCLWLKGLPPLLSTLIVEERRAWLPSNVGAGRRNGQRSQPGIAHTAKDASRTFPGIAAAMAAQWGAVNRIPLSPTTSGGRPGRNRSVPASAPGTTSRATRSAHERYPSLESVRGPIRSSELAIRATD